MYNIEFYQFIGGVLIGLSVGFVVGKFSKNKRQ